MQYYGDKLGIKRESLPTIADFQMMSKRRSRRLPTRVEEEMTKGLFDGEVYTERDILAIVKGYVLRVKDSKEEYQWAERPRDDKACKEIWPARVPADMRIRRLKLIDLIRELNDNEWNLIRRLKLDYVLVSNLVIYMKTWGTRWFARVYNTGILGSWRIFSQVSRLISSQVKRKKTDTEFTKQAFAELQALLGYQQLPFPGDGLIPEYNFFAELADLAKGGNEHGLIGDDWYSTFMKHLKKIKGKTPLEVVKYVTFEEYVKEGYWLTSGSSSIGKVTWTFEGKEGKFKARKNMLLDVYTKEELWEIVSNWDGAQHTTAIIKNELGKVRLAVASNIELYIHESYLMRQAGHTYRSWTGITLDESPTDNIRRVAKTSSLFRSGAFALPFDYAGFDHQVTTKEVQWIVDDYFKQGLSCVPQDRRAEFNKILVKTVDAYGVCDITGTTDGETKTYKVTGGLPSGVRVTSLVGNVWNGVLTSIAREVAKEILGYDPTLDVSLRGDDSLILCHTPLECYAVRLGYQAVNAIGHSAKFGICQGEGEFLRTVITSNGNYGWTNRAIPSVTQRKPWNPEPWLPNHQVKTLSANIDLLGRRSQQSVEWLHRANTAAWCKITGLDKKWLHLPVRLGGVGIYEFHGATPAGALHTGKKPAIQVRNIVDNPGPTWLTLNDEDRSKYNQQVMINKMVADDIPGVQAVFSRDFSRKNAGLRACQWHDEEMDTYSSVLISLPKPMTELNITWPSLDKHKFEPLDKTFPSVTMFMREHTVVQQAGIECPTLREYMDKVYPKFWALVKGWEEKGWHRTDAVELALGNIPCEPCPKINPLLTGYVKNYLVANGIYRWRGRRTIGEKISQFTRAGCDLLSTSEVGRYFRY
nr:MAG: putative RNA-dependent RNA polymerase [Totiviridae sp.]